MFLFLFLFLFLSFVTVCLGQVSINSNGGVDVTCHAAYMEICFKEGKNDYIWKGGNEDGSLTGHKLNACSSYSKILGDNSTVSCGITAYFQKNVETAIKVDDIDRYNCGNEMSKNEGSRKGFVTVTNVMAQPVGAVSLGAQVRYAASCTFNLEFENIEASIQMPQLTTKFETAGGVFNADMKICTSRQCDGYYALPASSTDIDNELVMQITTVGANLYPRLRNHCYCWRSFFCKWGGSYNSS
eukprot:Platyproteum_vivax@DN314_c0_g1_i1.p1